MDQQQHQIHSLFMRRALELARLGRGFVSPNPLVGSIVVYENRIIGEGWHQQYGGPHAEVNAIGKVDDKSLLSEATVYVTLEPCSHTGKTPPCADLLIRSGIKRVVVANLDTNPLVAGEGIRKLRAAGIEVITGVLEKEGRELNKRFFTFMEKQRPYIILKWAQTADGFIAKANYDSKWISNPYARQLVHKWRTEEDGILLGTTTVMYDNPQLNVRDWSGRDPVRIVLDRFLRLNEKLTVYNRKQRTLVYNLLKHEEHHNLSLCRVDEENFLTNVVRDLYGKRIQSIIVEGGAKTLQTFFDNELWDEVRIFKSPQHFVKGIKAPFPAGALSCRTQIGSDWLDVYTASR